MVFGQLAKLLVFRCTVPTAWEPIPLQNASSGAKFVALKLQRAWMTDKP